MKGYKALKALSEWQKIRRKGWPEGEFVELVAHEGKAEMRRHYPDHPHLKKVQVLEDLFSDLLCEDDWEVVE